MGGGVPGGGAGGGVGGGLPEGAGGALVIEMRLVAGGAPDGVVPNNTTHVWAWLKGPAQRFILPTWLAITLGHHIFSWRTLDVFELAHELCHVRQWDANGVMYIPRYFSAGRAAKAAGTDRYRGNSFEVEAYGVEDALRIARAGAHPV